MKTRRIFTKQCYSYYAQCSVFAVFVWSSPTPAKSNNAKIVCVCLNFNPFEMMASSQLSKSALFFQILSYFPSCLCDYHVKRRFVCRNCANDSGWVVCLFFYAKKRCIYGIDLFNSMIIHLFSTRLFWFKIKKKYIFSCFSFIWN